MAFDGVFSLTRSGALETMIFYVSNTPLTISSDGGKQPLPIRLEYSRCTKSCE